MPPTANTSTSTTVRSTATSSGCARSSRWLTTSSPRSKRCMASVIDTATAEPKTESDEAPRTERPSSAAALGAVERPRTAFGNHLMWRRGFGRRIISPLTRRIIAVNLIPVALLAVGFLYLGKFESSLIGQQIESLKTQGEIFAAALGEGAVLESADEGQVLLPDLARQMMRRLVEPTRTRARLFDLEGKSVADSRFLRGPGDAIQVTELPPLDDDGLIGRLAERVYRWVTGLMPQRGGYPPYHEVAGGTAENYPEVMQALHGESASAVRSDPQGGLVISVAVPLQRYKEVLGAVLLSVSNGEIEEELRTVRLELLRLFGATVLVTLLLSYYLAGTIARPVRRLAASAE